ncbi:Reverse transcriptase, RNA-dependent DNA polymerase [Corchorus capsularis]|uniref:Reverse transcriptase, RNA-dependent DNA polymerase n=1 Tax=Corchorus capsularis TaxID=210143 RepID=A0A1R3IIS7_COCAP|nr:Reverse transcriptase, RNA-dependent DNA polymerase [Corchorus capsularis]
MLQVKLTATNFSSWRAQFDALLFGYDLVGYVDGSLPAPASEIEKDGQKVPNPTYSFWMRQDKLILLSIFASTSENILPFIASSITSMEAWEKLIKIENPISFEELHDKVAAFELQLKHEAFLSDVSIPTAHYTGKSATDHSSRNFHSRGRSFHNGRGYNDQRSNSRPVCQICDKVGHLAKTCRQGKRFFTSSPTSSPTANYASATSGENSWCMDTGASHHITSNLKNLSIVSDYEGNDEVIVGNGSGLPITHSGIVNLHCHDKSYKLRDVLCVPTMKQDLIFVSKFCKTNNVFVEFHDDFFLIKDVQTKQALTRGLLIDDVYQLPTSTLLKSPFAFSSVHVSLVDWHNRLGHPSHSILQSILNNFSLPSSKAEFSLCNACTIANDISNSFLSYPHLIHLQKILLPASSLESSSLQQSSSTTAPVHEVPSTSMPSEVILLLPSSTAAPSVTPMQAELPSSSMPSQSLPVTSQGRASVRRPAGNTHSMQARAKNNIFKPKTVSIATKYPCSSSIELTCVSQALKDEKWSAAMSEEINALLRNGTCQLVPKSNAQNLVGCKWVFRIKRNPDGSVSRYKARGQRQNWKLFQLDVNNAFLQGTLDEDVFMKQPPGFVDSSNPNHVCKLKKALFGLKQAPRAWYTALSSFLHDYGFMQSKSDPSLFLYHKDGITVYFLVYVDDIILTGSDLQFVHKFVNALSTRFSLKELLPLHYFLGIETVFVRDGLFLSQRKYIVDLLQRTNMLDSKAVTTPMASTTSLTIDDSESLSDPTRAGDKGDRKSVSSYLIYFAGNLVSWKCSKQKTVAKSSTEAEYRAIANAAGESSWLQNILQELHVSTKQVPLILCDNVGATYVSMNLAFHSKMKHMSIDFHFVRDKVNTGQLTVRHVPTHDQLADLLTKPLPRSKFLHLVSKI